MGSFNEFLRNRGAKKLVNKFFYKVDSFNPTKRITSLDFSLADDSGEPASYYIENELTATQVINIEYTVTDDPVVYHTQFEIPREVDGAFIIEGSYRMPTSELGKDYNCRINMSGSGDYTINFDYERQYLIGRQVLKIKKGTSEYTDHDFCIKYDDIDTYENKEILKLSEYQSKKLQVKLDLDYKPEYITTKLIQECLAFGDDRTKDLIV